MSELKPCPFCGGNATPVYRHENGDLYTSNILMLSMSGTVKCKKCGVQLPKIYNRVSYAIKVWNRRAGEQDGNQREKNEDSYRELF